MLVPHNGIFILQGIEDNLADELSLIIDESAEAIGICWAFLLANKMIEEISKLEYFLPNLQTMVGSEGESAERMRKLRAKKLIPSKRHNVTQVCEKVTTEKEIDINISLSENIFIDISFQDFLGFLPKISKDISKIIEVANALGKPTFDDGYITAYDDNFNPVKITNGNEIIELDETQIKEVQKWLFEHRVKYFQLIAQKLQELPP